MFGNACLPGWPSGFGARSWFNSNGGFWLAMDRVGVCHPEMASEMLLCQFCSFHAYDAQMHSPCCFKTSPWQLLPILGSLWRVFLYFGVRCAILLASDGLFHHTGLLSKSSAEGINIQNHDCRNCVPSSTIVGYVAFYSQSAPSLFPTPIALS